MRALARKASKLAIYGAAGLCAQKSSASDKILKLCRSSSLAAKIGAGGLVCATPLALKLGAGVALKFAARKILTLGICELSKFAALKCAKLGTRAVVRSFSRTDKFTDERTKKRASADGESSKASAASRRKRTAGVSSASIKKDALLSKSVTFQRFGVLSYIKYWNTFLDTVGAGDSFLPRTCSTTRRCPRSGRRAEWRSTSRIRRGRSSSIARRSLPMSGN